MNHFFSHEDDVQSSWRKNGRPVIGIHVSFCINEFERGYYYVIGNAESTLRDERDQSGYWTEEMADSAGAC